VADFATLLASYNEGFKVLIEPHDATQPEPIIHLAALDASRAIAPVLDKFSAVIITSATLTPVDMYPKLLGFSSCVSCEVALKVHRPLVYPLVVTRGSDQMPVSSRFELRNDISVLRNYGSLITEMSKCVPDGVVCWFPSFEYMRDVVKRWDELDVLRKVRYGTVRYGTDTVRYGTILSKVLDTIRYDTIRYDTIRYDTRYDAVYSCMPCTDALH
jgi:DNA excision repair protein ERCC-2